MLTVERYLAIYIRRRRAVAFLRALFFATACGLLWLIIFPGFVPGDIVLMLAMMARSIWNLFRRHDAVAAAIEIEAVQPAFDQKLITVVSQQSSSPLTDHLRGEVESIIAQNKGRSVVKWRPLILPLIALIGVFVIFVLTHRHR